MIINLFVVPSLIFNNVKWIKLKLKPGCGPVIQTSRKPKQKNRKSGLHCETLP